MHEWWPHVFSFPRFLDPISWFWNSTKGYAFTSSGLQLTIPLGVVAWYLHHNCREKRCPWLGHAHPDHGLPVCRKHYHNDVRPKERDGT